MHVEYKTWENLTASTNNSMIKENFLFVLDKEKFRVSVEFGDL